MRRWTSSNGVILLFGTGDIGVAVLERLTARGIPVRLVGRSSRAVESVARTVGNHDQVTYRTCDLRNPRSLARAVACDGPLSFLGLVALQGLSIPDRLDRYQPRQIKDMIDVNLTSVLSATSSFLRTRRDKPTRIVWLSSSAALRGFPSSAVYAAAKGGLTAAARSMRVDFTNDTQLHVEHPGLVNTRGLRRAISRQARRQGIPAAGLLARIAGDRRVREPRDIAAKIVRHLIAGN